MFKEIWAIGEPSFSRICDLSTIFYTGFGCAGVLTAPPRGTPIALYHGMQVLNKVGKLVSKRSTHGIVLTIMTATMAVAVFNSASFPIEVKKITKIVLSAMKLEKDPNIVYNREEILSDYSNKVSEDFKIPADMRDRVGFWFDIYTRYDNNNRVIHNSMYPWIVYKVVDVSPIINAELPKHRWLRNVKADEFVKDEVAKIRDAMKSLSKRKNLDNLDEYETLVAKALNALPGKPQENAAEALKNLRVQTGQKNFFEEGLEVSPLYLSGMEEIFKDLGVPVELTRIPFVESSFNKHAVSKVGASGIWQFMGNTGRSFMTVNHHIDERHSPFKATEAAAKLLKENHMILYKSWPLAVTAWNHGPPGIRKAIKEVGSKNLGDIVADYRTKNFDFASSNFYSEFLAALYAERYQQDIFKDLNKEKSLEVHSVKLARTISAKELLRVSGLSNDDFIMFNPDLKNAVEKNASIPSGFKLMVNDSAKAVLKNLLAKESRPSKSKLSRNDVSLNMNAEIGR
ncbi:hypothetical protein DOE51_18965 [Bdellovibrio sp. NC01]|nr:hypothetical protein DOE51_18965 [Bdellovibrio sp. NC01]